MTNPVVLLVTAHRWPSTARTAMGFAEAGWTVEAMCPSGHFLESTNSIRRLHPWRFFAISQSIHRAVSRSKAELVVPCDDLVAGHLRELAVSDSPQKTSGELRALLARSLGDPLYFEDMASRSRIAGIARQQGVAIPETIVVQSVGDLESWIARNELPALLKVDGSTGGYGVRIVPTLDEARNAFATLSAPVGFVRAAKRAVIDNNDTFLMPSLKRVQPVVNVQRYIVGSEATSTAACWQGQVLACNLLRIVKTSARLGSSTVVQLIEQPEMLVAIQKMARCLHLSGLYGFDFILERESGRPFLLEINPRATPTTHLRTAAGSLPFALRLALTGEGKRPEPLYKVGDQIALFPQEWIRDHASEFLRASPLDVPWTEPGFIQACLRRNLGGPRGWLQQKLAGLLSKN
jgi:hypothetical protein